MARPKLNQVIAVVTSKKAAATAALTEAYHLLQKPALFDGMTRTYTSRTADANDGRPPERKNPQYNVRSVYQSIAGPVAEMFDCVLLVDQANCVARADVVVDGKTVLTTVPVAYLLMLEKRLVELKNLVEKMPLRDGAEDWTFQPESNLYVTPTSRKNVTAKNQEPLVLYQATEQHPAQTQLITRDVTVGHWDERKLSSAITKAEQDRMLERIRKLGEAVKVAREEANAIEVEAKQTAGAAILEHVFGGILADVSAGAVPRSTSSA